MASENIPHKRPTTTGSRTKAAYPARNKKTKRLTAVLGAFVVLCTAWALMLPAISMTGESATPNAGFFNEDAAGGSANGDTPAGEVAWTAALMPGDSGSLSAPAPAQTFDQEITTAAGDTLAVHVEADEGAFAEGTTMDVEEVVDQSVLDAAKQTAADNTSMPAERTQAVAADITFRDAAGAEVQPAKDVRVTMRAQALQQSAQMAVVHLDADQNGEEDAKVMGGKTGFTDEAMFTLSTVADYNGKEYICVTTKSESDTAATEDTILVYENYLPGAVGTPVTSDSSKDENGDSIVDLGGSSSSSSADTDSSSQAE